MTSGGYRPGSGRKKGVDDATLGARRASLEELARAHTQEALDTLVRIATKGESAAAVSAAGALLDRGYGKARQHVDADGGVKLKIVLSEDDMAL